LSDKEISYKDKPIKNLHDQVICHEDSCVEIIEEGEKCLDCGKNDGEAQEQDATSATLSSMLNKKSSKAKKLIRQFSFIFWSNIFATALFVLGSFDIIPKSNTTDNIIVLLILILSLAFYIQVGRVASSLGRSIITWIGICIIFQAIGSIYAFCKLQTLLRDNVF